MSLINLVVVLIVVGVLLWPVNSFIPMDPKIKNILNVVLWLLAAFGLLSGMDTIRIGRLRT